MKSALFEAYWLKTILRYFYFSVKPSLKINVYQYVSERLHISQAGIKGVTTEYAKAVFY